MPAQEDDQSALIAGSLAMVRGPAATPLASAGRLTLLHIDEDVAGRQTLQDQLRAMGHMVFQAESAARGLELARLAMFNAIFIDWGLRGMSAVEVARLLKTSPGPERAVPVIVIASQDSMRRVPDYRALGFSGVLMKPVLVRDLGQVLEQVDAAAHLSR